MEPVRNIKRTDGTRYFSQGFRTTRWSVVRAAGSRGHPSSKAAMEELCRIYWQPLYVYARHRGATYHDAVEQVQDFILNVLEKRKIEKVDPVRGTFRSFLQSAFTNFLINGWRKATTAKRSNGRAVLCIDDEKLANSDDSSLCRGLSADQAFRIQWRRTIIDRAVTHLGTTLENRVDKAIFDAFGAKYGAYSAAAPKYSVLARQLGISEANVKIRMNRLRQRLGAFIRDEVRQTVSSQSQLEEELNDLINGDGGKT